MRMTSPPKLAKGKASKLFEEMVPEWCRDFADLFEKGNFDEPPRTKDVGSRHRTHSQRKRQS